MVEGRHVLVALLLLCSAIQWFQFVRFRRDQVNGGSHARVHAIAKIILSLLVGYEYEWAPHFTALFAVIDLRNSFTELIALKSIKSSHSVVIITDLAILVFSLILIFR